MKSRIFEASQIERLNSFNTPWEGEALLGILTRGYARFGEDVSSFMSALIGKIRCKGTLDPAMPTYTARMAQAMPAGHPLADLHVLLRHHTALPYYLFFASETRRREVLKVMEDLRTTNLSCVLGFSTSRLRPAAHGRICRKCRAQDIERGAPTFRIAHQLPSSFVCIDHDEILTDGCATCGRAPKRGRLLDLAGTCGDPTHTEQLPCGVVDDDDERADIEWMARQGAFMLERFDDIPVNPLDQLRQIALLDHGRCGGLNGESLAHAIEQRFSPKLLQRFGMSFSSDRERLRGWHWQLLTKSTTDRLKEPAQCMVVLGALGLDVNSFLAWRPDAEEQEVWPRLHWETELAFALEVSEGALDPVRKLYGISFNRLWKAMIDQELTVARRAPLPVSNAEYQRILHAWRGGRDQAQMMSSFGVTEHFLKMMVLWEPGLHHQWITARREVRLNPYRDRIMRYLEEHPMAGRNQVRHALPTEYAAVAKVDLEWIDTRIPRRQGNHRNTDGSARPRKDWAKRDKTVAAAVENWVRDHHASGEKPVYLSAAFLLRKVGSPKGYGMTVDRYPLTKQVLRRDCEEFATYRERRVRWAARTCARSFMPLKVDVIRQVAGFPRKQIEIHWQLAVESYLAAGGSEVTAPAKRRKRAATRHQDTSRTESRNAASV